MGSLLRVDQNISTRRRVRDTETKVSIAPTAETELSRIDDIFASSHRGDVASDALRWSEVA
jgi:hypothetical protein